MSIQAKKIGRPKKALGQNFLKSGPALSKMIEAGEVTSSDTVLEIGPGKGVLTFKLLEKAGQVIAVEKDRELYEFLKIKFESEIHSGSLVLVHDDILEFDASATRYKVVANIPYNITGAILKKFLTAEHQPMCMILMVQQEVAQRIVARDGKESILSISVKAYGEPKMIMKVPKRYFSPVPKVDSAIVAIQNISRKNFLPPLLSGEGRGEVNGCIHPGASATPREGNRYEEKFWHIVKTGFAHKRKKLSGNLKGVVSLEKDDLVKFKDKRAEELSLSDWLAIAK